MAVTEAGGWKAWVEIGGQLLEAAAQAAQAGGLDELVLVVAHRGQPPEPEEEAQSESSAGQELTCFAHHLYILFYTILTYNFTPS